MRLCDPLAAEWKLGRNGEEAVEGVRPYLANPNGPALTGGVDSFDHSWYFIGACSNNGGER